MSKNKAIDFGYLKNAIKYYGDAISYRQKVIDLRCDKDLEDAIRQVEDANRQINEALTEMQNIAYLKNAIKYYGDAISYRQKVIDLRYDKDLGDAIRQVEDANRQINEALTEMQSNTINESSSIEIVVIGESIIHFQ